MASTETYQHFQLDDNDTIDSHLSDCTAWDLFNTISKPEHKLYKINNHTKETIPIITNTFQHHGLNGLNTGDIIEIIGNEQSGKTQLLYQYIINCCLLSEITVIHSTRNNKPTILNLGGQNSKLIFIDINLSFHINRLFDIFQMQIKRKITKHNSQIQEWRAEIIHEPNIEKEKILKTMFEIDQRKFLEFESKKLWHLLYTKVYLIQPQTPIQFVVSLHKIRSMLKSIYANNNSNNRNDMVNDDETNGDNGMRLILIDNINGYFNELTATKERDKYYNIISDLLIDICNEFGLILFFTRYTQFKKEKEWLKQLLPLKILIDIKMGNRNDFMFKPQDMFHKKFGHIQLENKVTFVIYLYRQPMECFDSTVTHPAISNDLFMSNTNNNNNDIEMENIERKLYLIGDDNVTRQWVMRQSELNLDPMSYIKEKQKEGVKKIYGKEEYNIIRGCVVTQQEFIDKMKKNIHKKGYENVIMQKKMIKFYAIVTKQSGFVYFMPDVEEQKED